MKQINLKLMRLYGRLKDFDHPAQDHKTCLLILNSRYTAPPVHESWTSALFLRVPHLLDSYLDVPGPDGCPVVVEGGGLKEGGASQRPGLVTGRIGVPGPLAVVAEGGAAPRRLASGYQGI